MNVKLSWFEVLAAAYAGVMRRVESIRRNYKSSAGFDRTDVWDIDINGAAAEMAVAKCLNKYWDASVNGFHRGDVGNYQIRLARSDTPYLLIREKDDEKAVFVSVQGTAPDFKVHGWLRGSEGKKAKYLRTFGTRPPVYAIPPKYLHKMSTLPRPKINNCPTDTILEKKP